MLCPRSVSWRISRSRSTSRSEVEPLAPLGSGGGDDVVAALPGAKRVGGQAGAEGGKTNGVSGGIGYVHGNNIRHRLTIVKETRMAPVDKVRQRPHIPRQ